MSAFVDFKKYRRPRESWLLPDSRAKWFLQVLGAVVLGVVIALSYRDVVRLLGSLAS